MAHDPEEDKPTVVLDLNALKKLKQKEEEDLASLVSGLEFNTPEASVEAPKTQPSFQVILFDFQSDFFKKSLPQFPKDFNYKVITTLPELNQCLKSKEFQIVVFNFDVNSKAVNQLTAQIKQKMPHTKTLIMAKAISPEKAKIHASTPSGADGYYQFPIEASKLEQEILKIYSAKKAA